MWREHLPEIRRIALGLGLQPREVEFLEVPAEDLYAVQATRIPGMYHHWSFGRNYGMERGRHDRGRGTVYEMVVNLDPARAYLLDQNSEAEHLFVAAHVLGHVDLFGRNCFSRSQRLDMTRVLAAARERFTEYEHQHGEAAVERVLDAAHMVMWHSTPVPRAEPRPPEDLPPDPFRALFPEERASGGPQESARYREDARRHRRGIGERDLLRFLIAQAPLEPWQADVLTVVREVALYLLPQTRVKILHEGWASFWHLRILREMHALDESDVQDARLHASVVGDPQGGGNPYWLGLTILEHLRREGVDLFALAATESDRSLLERIDAEIVQENPYLRTVAAELATKGNPRGLPGWQRLRDAWVASLPRLPEVEVVVDAWDTRHLVLRAPVTVDETYARPVLAALSDLWGGEASLVTSSQEIRR
jgi:stage V sporulation protein R